MFKVKDPCGNTIILTKECWNEHICTEHTIMKTLLNKIEDTIKNPDYIYHSKTGKNSYLYFKESKNISINCDYVLVVVFRKFGVDKGYVQSAYPVKNLSKGGTVEWKKA